MRIVGVTGMPGSGKSEAMKMAHRMKLPVVRMGDLVWDEVDAQGLPRDAKHVGQVANAMRESEGPDVWALRTVERIKALGDVPLSIIDGIRSNHEVEVFRRELGDDFILVAVHTDPDERHGRLTRRARDDDPTELAQHQERDSRELGWGLARTIAMSDEMLVNDGDLETFHASVEGLLDRIAESERVQPILD